MNAMTITNLYNATLDLCSGASIVNFDLHIHTPASKDFKVAKDKPEKENYYALLDEIIANHIEIIAITDHNTFDGYNNILTFLHDDRIAQKKYQSILILCGIEITCYSSHLLAIFNTNFSVDQQDQFLHEIGVDKNSRGTEEALADELGPAALLRKINEYGGIAILAHAETEKGFLYSFFSNKGSEIAFKGKSLEKIVKSPYLYGIQVCSDFGEKRIEQVLSNTVYRREDRKLPYLYFSDAHGLVVEGKYSGKSGKHIGAVVSKAKLSHKSFSALKMALSDMETRIVTAVNHADYPIIIGCAIKSDIVKSNNEEYALFRFSEQLNCIIGSRGTGKSTLLGIIRDVLEYEIFKSEYGDRYHAAVVFISIGGITYAISNDINRRSIYVKGCNSYSFKLHKDTHDFLNLFLTKSYNQGELYDYHMRPNRILEIIDNFIMWKHYKKYGDYIKVITQTTENMHTLFERCIKTNKNLVDYIKDEGIESTYMQRYYEIQAAKNGIVQMRDDFVKQINEILTGKMKIRITFELNDILYKYLTEEFPSRVAKTVGRYYDYVVKIKKFIESIIEKSKVKTSIDFFTLLISGQNDKIFDEYYIERNSQNIKYMNDIKGALKPTDLMMFLENGACLQYNVNSGIPKTSPIFRDSKKLSLGQNAVALLLVILTASQGLDDNRPLLMDQPEDDLDNSYIYNTLVDEFRNSKCNRQLIISTHNANIPVAADAENIIVLQYNGEYGYMASNGSLDNPKISKAVLEILEGGELALRSRNEKYRNIILITK
ncbi:MAG: hypothetical protein LBI19_00645 [Oscillospiraceae bacterium]|jgi:predicted ATP-dependent endonuclease of OLD family|nr:hypothetical protein [Oscillospiraceae bacterium]